jgi:hypothetical protein
VLAFVALVVASLAVAGGYVGWTLATTSTASDGTAAGTAAVVQARAVAFQNLADDGHYGRVALVGPEGAPARTTSSLACDRVHFAAGTGLCLVRRRWSLAPRIEVKIFDPAFHVRKTLVVGGLASRTRVSPDGRYGSVTAFELGHSYAELGAFSTRATLIDLRAGRSLGDLEDFEVTKDGRPFSSIDFNFWGVTFARNSNVFYATLATRGTIYLVVGNVRKRTLRVLNETVECPSLSPDGERIAFKQRRTYGVGWRLHVLDLGTGRMTRLAERRSVDDQVEWLDNRTILYGLNNDVWRVPADGRGRPQVFIEDARSPAVARPGPAR